jgi:hypothetical protein
MTTSTILMMKIPELLEELEDIKARAKRKPERPCSSWD